MRGNAERIGWAGVGDEQDRHGMLPLPSFTQSNIHHALLITQLAVDVWSEHDGQTKQHGSPAGSMPPRWTGCMASLMPPGALFPSCSCSQCVCEIRRGLQTPASEQQATRRPSRQSLGRRRCASRVVLEGREAPQASQGPPQARQAFPSRRRRRRHRRLAAAQPQAAHSHGWLQARQAGLPLHCHRGAAWSRFDGQGCGGDR